MINIQKNVKLIYKTWVGGFISGDAAMSKIGEELKYKTVSNVEMKDFEGNIIAKFERARVKIE